MEPRTLNTIATLSMAVTGVFWIGFQFSPSLLLLAAGAVFYFIGLTAFVAFVVAMIDGFIRDNELLRPGEFQTRTG